MKKLIKIIIWLLAIALVISIACSIVVALYGKKVIISQIEQNLKVKVKLEKVSFSLPLSVNLSGLEIGNLLKAEKISATPSILGFFAGKVVLSGLTIVNPVINLEQEKDGSLNLPKLEQKGKQPSILLAGLTIQNGRFVFTDKKIAEDYKVILDKINADISKVKFPPTSLNTKFKISADFVKPDSKALGNISFEGWLDFGPKDMDATLELKDLDIVYFFPYQDTFILKIYNNILNFSSPVAYDKKPLSAKLDLTSELKAKNNDLAVVSKLKLHDLAFEKELHSNKEAQSIVNALEDLVKVVNISLDFTINTKLDNPKVSDEELKNIIKNAAIKSLSKQSTQAIIEKVTGGNIEQFKEIGKQFKEMFKKKGE